MICSKSICLFVAFPMFRHKNPHTTLTNIVPLMLFCVCHVFSYPWCDLLASVNETLLMLHVHACMYACCVRMCCPEVVLKSTWPFVEIVNSC